MNRRKINKMRHILDDIDEYDWEDEVDYPYLR
jgi:hypothetical protein